MSKRKSPAEVGDKHDHKHTKTVARWAKRKAKEAVESQARLIDDITLAGSWRSMGRRRQYAERVKADLRRKEREMLETTSLKDLIK